MAKAPSPMIDPKKLKVDVLRLINENKADGLKAKKLAGLLGKHNDYVTYPEDYVLEWVMTRLAQLRGEGLLVLVGDRYFPVESATT
jgi:hypothetical protein